MIQEERVIVECFADRMVFQEILDASVRKGNGCNDVIATVKNEELKKNGVLIGIIDNDKHKGNFYHEFKLVESKESFSLLKLGNESRYLVEIKPKAIESWLLHSANSIQLSPKDYDLPTTPKKLKRITRKSRVGQHENFRRFVLDLISLRATPIEDIKQIIKDMLGNSL